MPKLKAPQIDAEKEWTTAQPTEEMEKLADELAKSKLCGHINKQHHNTDGRLEDLACDLPKGHAGDHHAIYFRNVPDPLVDNRGIVLQQRYNQVEDDAFWGDAAGVPASQIKEGKILQLSQYQKDIVADILKKNPNISAEEAIAQAKLSPIWLAGNV